MGRTEEEVFWRQKLTQGKEPGLQEAPNLDSNPLTICALAMGSLTPLSVGSSFTKQEYHTCFSGKATRKIQEVV